MEEEEGRSRERQEEGYMSGNTSWNHPKYGAWSPLKDPEQEAAWSVLRLKVSLVYWCANSWCTNSMRLFMLRTGSMLNWQKIFLREKLLNAVSSQLDWTLWLSSSLKVEQGEKQYWLEAFPVWTQGFLLIFKKFFDLFLLICSCAKMEQNFQEEAE